MERIEFSWCDVVCFLQKRQPVFGFIHRFDRHGKLIHKFICVYGLLSFPVQNPDCSTAAQQLSGNLQLFFRFNKKIIKFYYPETESMDLFLQNIVTSRRQLSNELSYHGSASYQIN